MPRSWRRAATPSRHWVWTATCIRYSSRKLLEALLAYARHRRREMPQDVFRVLDKLDKAGLRESEVGVDERLQGRVGRLHSWTGTAPDDQVDQDRGIPGGTFGRSRAGGGGSAAPTLRGSRPERTAAIASGRENLQAICTLSATATTACRSTCPSLSGTGLLHGVLYSKARCSTRRSSARSSAAVAMTDWCSAFSGEKVAGGWRITGCRPAAGSTPPPRERCRRANRRHRCW